MSEEGQYYDLVPDYDENKDSQTIPPISTFAKRTGSGGSTGPDEYASPPRNFYNPETDVQPSGDLENNNNNTDSNEAPPPVTPTNSQPPEPTTILQQQQQQSFNTLAPFQSGNSQVHLPVSGSNTAPPSHVVNNVVPTGLHAGVPIQGNLIPFITTNGGQSPGLHTPEQMVQFSAAMNLAAAAAAASSMGGGQSVFTSAPGQPGVIQVHDSMQHPALHPNIDLQHHLVPPHAMKNGKEMPPTPPASADEKDGDDSERRKTLANLVPHTHQPLPTSMPSMPVPHLMPYNPAQTTLAGPAPNFVPGSGPGSGPAPVTYGNQIPLQNPPPPVSMPHPVGPPQPIIGDQPNVMMPPIDCVDHGAGPSSRRQAQNNKRRGNKKAVPVEDKDDRYFERRKRNNQAAKRSRDARKVREEQVGMRANYLEKENAILRAQLATLREEANSLRQLLSQRPPVSQMGAPTCM